MLFGFTFIFLLLFLFLLTSVFLFIFVSPVQAKVLINEVYPNPISGESEWVELFNDSTISASLDGWVLEDKLSSSKVIYSFNDISLLSNQYYLASISGQLNNNGDGVILKNNLGEVIDQMDYSTSSQGLSWAKQADVGYILSNPSPLGSNQVVADPSPITSLSPTSIIFPQPSPSLSPIFKDLTGKLELVKLMSCPENSNEWFELKNISDNDLVGELLLSDSQNNKFNFELNLSANQSFRYYLNRHILNNSGDTLTIIQKPDISLFSYNIPACKEKNIEFILQNGQLIQIIGGSALQADSKVNFDQGKILGVTDESLETEKIFGEEKVKQFQVPFSYLSKINLLSTEEASQQASSEAMILDNKEAYLEEDNDNSSLYSVIFIISGGIILSFLGIMYFYGKDWFENHPMV